MIFIELVCPYCGTKFRVGLKYDQILESMMHHEPIRQLCPDDEYENACGNLFFYQLDLVVVVEKYFADTKELNRVTYRIVDPVGQ